MEVAGEKVISGFVVMRHSVRLGCYNSAHVITSHRATKLWTRDSSILLGGFFVTIILIVYIWWPLAVGIFCLCGLERRMVALYRLAIAWYFWLYVHYHY